MKSKFNALSIRAKLLFIMILFLLFPFLFFGVIWYKESTKLIEKNAIQYGLQLVQQQNRYLDYYFRNLQRSTFPLTIHPLIQKFIQTQPDRKYQYYHLSSRINDEIMPELRGRQDIYSFQIASETGVATSREAYRRYESYTKEKAPSLLNYQLRGFHVRNGIPVITLTQGIFDLKSYQNIGMFIIDLKVNVLNSICKQTDLGNSGSIWIVAPDGKVLYQPNSTEAGTETRKIKWKAMIKNESGSLIKTLNGKKQLITYNRSPITNLTIMAEVPLNELTGNLIFVRNITMIFGFILVITALGLFLIFSLSLTNSLRRLQGLMKKVEVGDLRVRAPEKRNDEIGKVNKGFNKMVKELKRLFEVVHKAELKEKDMEIKQRDSMLKAMESQINPHFLYNSLELINSHAITEGNMEISKMVTSLADVFRYKIKNQQQLVSLYDEVENVKSYLQIQKARYPYLDVQIDLNEEELKRIRTLV